MRDIDDPTVDRSVSAAAQRVILEAAAELQFVSNRDWEDCIKRAMRQRPVVARLSRARVAERADISALRP